MGISFGFGNPATHLFQLPTPFVFIAASTAFAAGEPCLHTNRNLSGIEGCLSFSVAIPLSTNYDQCSSKINARYQAYSSPTSRHRGGRPRALGIKHLVDLEILKLMPGWDITPSAGDGRTTSSHMNGLELFLVGCHATRPSLNICPFSMLSFHSLTLLWKATVENL